MKFYCGADDQDQKESAGVVEDLTDDNDELEIEDDEDEDEDIDIVEDTDEETKE